MLGFRQHIMVQVIKTEEEDYDMLEKYKDGKKVDPEDISRVERLSNGGLMHMGHSFSTSTFLAAETASTNYLGRRVLSSHRK